MHLTPRSKSKALPAPRSPHMISSLSPPCPQHVPTFLLFVTTFHLLFFTVLHPYMHLQTIEFGFTGF